MPKNKGTICTQDGTANDVLVYCPTCNKMHKAQAVWHPKYGWRYIGKRCKSIIKKST